MLYIIVMDGVGITVSHVKLHLNPNLAFSHRSNRKNLVWGGGAEVFLLVGTVKTSILQALTLDIVNKTVL